MLLKKFNKILLMLFTIGLLYSCGETKDLEETEENTDDQNSVRLTGEIAETVLPSVVAYYNETKDGIKRVLGFEAKSDSKSKYLAVVFEANDGDIFEANFHYEGEYNKTPLSLKHPFIVVCEGSDDCFNCGFKVTPEGTVCGCNDDTKVSPCMLTVDHIMDFDFYENYHKKGLELIKELNNKRLSK